MIYYNYNGEPVGYKDDGEDTFFLFSGEPVAYVDGNAIFSFRGKQLGWLESGWVRDLSGNCVFFSSSASGFGPIKPIARVAPIPGPKWARPVSNVHEVQRVKAIPTLSWSPLSGKIFFYQ